MEPKPYPIRKLLMMIVYLLLLFALVYLIAEWRSEIYFKQLQNEKLLSAISMTHAYDETLFLTIDFNQPDETIHLAERYFSQLNDMMILADFSEVYVMYPSKEGPAVGMHAGKGDVLEYKEIDSIKQKAQSIFDEGVFLPQLMHTTTSDSLTLSVFVPYINLKNNEVHSVFVFVSNNNECFHQIKKLKVDIYLYSFVAVLLLVIIYALVAWRSTKAAEVQIKFRHIETLGVLILGLYVTILSIFAVREMTSNEMVSAFKNQTSPHVAAIRHSFWKVRQGLNAFAAFMQNSEKVDAMEFLHFSEAMDKRTPIIGLTYYEKELANANTTNAALKNYEVPGTGYRVIHTYGDNELLTTAYLFRDFMEELKLLLEKTEKSKLPEASKVVHLGSESTDRYILVAFPVDYSHVANNNRLGIMVSLVSPFQLLQNSLFSYDYANNNIPFGLAELMKSEGSEWFSSWPPEHIKLHKGENIQEHLQSFSHSESHPVFAFGRAYTIMTHSSTEFEAPFYQAKIYPVLFALLLITLLSTFITALAKNRLVDLETQVGDRTLQLQRKVSELDTMGQLLERLQYTANIHDVMAWFPEFFCHAFSGNADLCIQIRFESKVYHCEQPSLFDKSFITMLIMPANQALGEIRIAAKSGRSLLKDDKELLSKYVSIFSRWLEHQQMAFHLHQSEQRFHELINASFDSIYMIENNRFVWVNDAFCQLTGYTREELTAPEFNMTAMVTENSKEIIRHRQEARALGTTLPARYEFEQKSKTGEVKQVEVTTVTIPGSASKTVLGILRDITDSKKAMRALLESEERLQQQNEELQVLNEEITVSSGQIREMNLELLKAKELAEASDKLKTAFLNNISHEVRTPLNGIVGASSLMADPDSSLEERSEMAGIIMQSTQRLLRTITQYMDISMLNSNNMPVYVTEFSLQDFLQPVMDEFRKECVSKNLKFEAVLPDEAILFKSDKSLIEKVLIHLLENAVKFTDQGSVSCRVQRQNDKVEFIIEDTGIGIDKHFHPRIFNVFAQEDDSNMRKYDGSGLGLPICRKALDLLGGTITFESEKGRGTRFLVTLPGTFNANAKKVDEKAARISASGPLVLIAEDEDSNYTVLNMLLEKKLKARVIRAVNGQEAVDHVRKNSEIQLVLMDIKMPVMDGFEATRLIKALRSEVPVIAITAYGLSGDEQRALDAGCNDYLAKPIQTALLFEKINKLI